MTGGSTDLDRSSAVSRSDGTPTRNHVKMVWLTASYLASLPPLRAPITKYTALKMLLLDLHLCRMGVPRGLSWLGRSFGFLKNKN
jgi:hypothetical protein